MPFGTWCSECRIGQANRHCNIARHIAETGKDRQGLVRLERHERFFGNPGHRALSIPKLPLSPPNWVPRNPTTEANRREIGRSAAFAALISTLTAFVIAPIVLGGIMVDFVIVRLVVID